MDYEELEAPTVELVLNNTPAGNAKPAGRERLVLTQARERVAGILFASAMYYRGAPNYAEVAPIIAKALNGVAKDLTMHPHGVPAEEVVDMVDGVLTSAAAMTKQCLENPGSKVSRAIRAAAEKAAARAGYTNPESVGVTNAAILSEYGASQAQVDGSRFL